MASLGYFQVFPVQQLSQVKIARWNPRTDVLLTVSSVPNQASSCVIACFRSNWKKINSFSSSSLVSSVQWSHDGKFFALGHSDGSISVVNLETFDSIKLSPLNATPITDISWSTEPTLTSNPYSFPSLTPHLKLTTASTNTNSNNKGIFASVSKNNISIRLNHGLPLCSYSLPRSQIVRSASLHSSTATLSILSTTTESDQKEYYFTRIDTKISRHLSPILSLADKTTIITESLKQLTSAIQKANKDWNMSEITRRQRVDRMEEVIRNNEGLETLQLELMVMVATCLPKHGLVHYILRDLGAQGCKKWMKETQGAYTNLINQFESTCIPICYKLILEFESIKKLHTYRNRRILGFTRDDVDDCMKITHRILLEVQEMVKILYQARESATAFSTWIYKIIDCLNDSEKELPHFEFDIPKTCAYIEKYLCQNALEKHFATRMTARRTKVFSTEQIYDTTHLSRDFSMPTMDKLITDYFTVEEDWLMDLDVAELCKKLTRHLDGLTVKEFDVVEKYKFCVGRDEVVMDVAQKNLNGETVFSEYLCVIKGIDESGVSVVVVNPHQKPGQFDVMNTKLLIPNAFIDECKLSEIKIVQLTFFGYEKIIVWFEADVLSGKPRENDTHDQEDVEVLKYRVLPATIKKGQSTYRGSIEVNVMRNLFSVFVEQNKMFYTFDVEADEEVDDDEHEMEEDE
ncbi:hypothetical protein HK098_004482 [Nowakowskiella sp. JEL0407]|nr:hypothetical protein HK098_004482 [Nowakowskiella sp. JEL0407]